MPKRKPNIKGNPKAEEAFQRAIESAKNLPKEEKPTIKDTKSLLQTPAIGEAMLDILEASRMSEPQKRFLEEVFIHGNTRKGALAKAFNRNLKGQEDAVATGILNHPDVQEFLDTVRLFYVEVAPFAALKETEILLSPNSSAKDKLQAAKQIKSTAGIGEEVEKKGHLPVNITINMPNSEPKTVIDMSGVPRS